MAHRLVLVAAIAVLLSVVPASALADKQAYARFADNTLTFYYDENMGLTDTDYSLNTGSEDPAWLSIGTQVYKVVFDKSFSSYRPTTCYKWFCGMSQLASVEGTNYLVGYATTNTNSMFSGCSSLKSLVLSKFHTAKATDMSAMFHNCSSLTEFDIPLLTVSAENMADMFSGCSSLTELDLFNFTNANVKNVKSMFNGCTALEKVDLSHFATDYVTDMESMFAGCSKLTTLDLSMFNTSNVANMKSMFDGCASLTGIAVSLNFTTTSVANSENMFNGCSSLSGAVSYDESKTDAKQANWESGYLTLWVGPYVRYEDETLTFYYGSDKHGGDYGLEMMDGESEWEGTVDPTKVVFDKSFSNVRPTTTEAWFYGMSELTSIEGIENLNTSEVTNMSYMFNGCESLASIDLSHFNTKKVTDMRDMFYNSSCLTSLDFSSFDTGNVTDMAIMFMGCNELMSIDLSHFNTENVTDMSDMFKYCSALTTIDLSSFNTKVLKDCTQMFQMCTSLNTIYVSDNFTTDNVTQSGSMFDDCKSLKGAVAYDANNIRVGNANYITGYFTKKVGTNGSDVIGATGSPLTIENLAIDDNKAFTLNEGEECQAATAQYSRDMTSQWGTLCLPFAIDAADDGNTCQFYSLQSVDDESITLTKIESGTIEAGKPMVICRKTNDQIAISITATDAAVVSAPVNATSGNRLVGTFDGKMLTDDGYFIAKDKFYSAADYSDKGVKVNPFRAYIQTGDTSVRASALHIVADGEAAGIDATRVVDSLNNVATEYYDMSGHRINGLQKGINIVKTGNKTMKIIVR